MDITADHELKTDSNLFEMSWKGKRSWEIRFNDRNFKVGDVIHLRETKYTGDEMRGDNAKPLIYTGRSMLVKVTGIVHGPILDKALKDGWCILNVEPIDKRSVFIPNGEDEGTAIGVFYGHGRLKTTLISGDMPMESIELVASPGSWRKWFEMLKSAMISKITVISGDVDAFAPAVIHNPPIMSIVEEFDDIEFVSVDGTQTLHEILECSDE